LKVAVSATGPGLDDEVDPRFGRCQYFIIADPDTMEFQALENTSQMASGGAGIASARMVAGEEVDAVLTGNCGPNAYQTLEAAGIEVVTGASGTVREALEGYKSGRFQADSGPSVNAHFGVGGGGTGPDMGPGTGPGMDSGMGRGMGIGMGRGMGMGMGRGMGMGMGRGMGMGMGRGMGMGPGMGFGPGADMGPGIFEQELAALKSQSEIMSRQMSEIIRRLDELERKMR